MVVDMFPIARRLSDALLVGDHPACLIACGHVADVMSTGFADEQSHVWV